MTSDRKLKASREGSKLKIYRTAEDDGALDKNTFSMHRFHPHTGGSYSRRIDLCISQL